jgi:hypothetical protein
MWYGVWLLASSLNHQNAWTCRMIVFFCFVFSVDVVHFFQLVSMPKCFGLWIVYLSFCAAICLFVCLLTSDLSFTSC